jgi:hypothetical protein
MENPQQQTLFDTWKEGEWLEQYQYNVDNDEEPPPKPKKDRKPWWIKESE